MCLGFVQILYLLLLLPSLLIAMAVHHHELECHAEKVDFFIGRFSEAGLLEWMRFVIFRARSRSTLPGRFLSRRCFTLCITVKVKPRIVKQYKWQYCCSCKIYRGKGMEGGKKSVFALFFGWPEDRYNEGWYVILCYITYGFLCLSSELMILLQQM